MITVERISSGDGNEYIEIVKEDDGMYLLRKYAQMYDTEEETAYTVEVLPKPASRFASLDLARNESKRLLGLGLLGPN